MERKRFGRLRSAKMRINRTYHSDYERDSESVKQRSHQSGRTHLWKIAVSFVASAVVHGANAASPRAIAVPVDETRWIGDDGLWSPVQLGIGSPAQAVDLFPSTTGQETLVIGASGCSSNTACLNSRGGIFASNMSTSFQSSGNYAIGSDRALGGSGGGFYGLDTITIPLLGTLQHQIIGIINSTEYWVGLLGLGTESTILGTANTTSFLASLATGATPLIPSLSYGYTAGAHYRSKQVPSSLTLGGYDANRIQSSNATFYLSDSQQPALFLQALSASGFQNISNTSLIEGQDAVLVTIDSSTPFLWLPEAIAIKLGDQLGLVYNDTLDLFVYPNTSHYSAMASSNLSLNFGFSDQSQSPVKFILNIDGQAFTTTNMSVNAAHLSQFVATDSIPYFPIRKAINTQYTLGRVFLQEAYLIVDYESNKFTLAEAKFDSTTTKNIVDISSSSQAGSTPNPTNVSATGLSVGVEAGVGVAVAILTVGVLVAAYRYFILRTRAKNHQTHLPPELSMETKHDELGPHLHHTESELPASEGSLGLNQSSHGRNTLFQGSSELDANGRFFSFTPGSVHNPRELPDSPPVPPAELSGSPNMMPYISKQLCEDALSSPSSQQSQSSSHEPRIHSKDSPPISDISEVKPIPNVSEPS